MALKNKDGSDMRKVDLTEKHWDLLPEDYFSLDNAIEFTLNCFKDLKPNHLDGLFLSFELFHELITECTKAGFKFGKNSNLPNKEFDVDDLRKIAQAAFVIKSSNGTIIEDFDRWFENRLNSLRKNKNEKDNKQD